MPFSLTGTVVFPNMPGHMGPTPVHPLPGCLVWPELLPHGLIRFFLRSGSAASVSQPLLSFALLCEWGLIVLKL